METRSVRPRRISKVTTSLIMAGLCLIIFLIPYAGLVGLGPPALAGVLLAMKARRSGDRRPIVWVALTLNGLWLSLALVFAWGFLAFFMGWPSGF